MRLPLFAAAASAAVLFTSLAAHADTITYLVNATYVGGGSVSGTLILNNAANTKDIFTAALTSTGFPHPDQNGNDFTFVHPYTNPVIDVSDPNQNDLVFTTAIDDFTGYKGLSIPVLLSEYDSGSDGSSFKATSVSIVQKLPSAATPEPASIALLGTGVLGMFGVLRRRLIS